MMRTAMMMVLGVCGLMQGCGAFVVTQNGIPISGPDADSGEEITIKPGTTPVPVRRALNLKNGDRHMGDIFPGCGGSYTTVGPALRFTLTKATKDLRLLVDGSSAVLVMPGMMSKFICIKGGGVKLDEWAAGTYKLYLHGPSVGLAAKVQIDAPEQLLAEATKTAQEAPMRPATEPRRNPLWYTLPPALVVDADVSGVSCARDGQLSPVGRLDVLSSSRYAVTSDTGRLLVTEMSGECVSEDARNVTLKKGQYVLWGQVREEEPKPWEIEVMDLEHVMAWEDGPRVTLGQLAEPLAIPVTTAPLARQPSEGCRRGSREPSFLLEIDQPLDHLELDTLRGEGLRYNVYGPLETIKPGDDMKCDLREFSRTDAAGTYAVWVYAEDGAQVSGHLVARRPEIEPDPMATPIPIPAQLALEERIVAFHYPYRKGSYEPLFLNAPEQMFVFAKVDAGEVAAGEPLLLIRHEATKAVVVRFDGSDAKINPNQLATERPAQVVLPERAPEAKKAGNVSEALNLAGKSEAPYTKKYLERRDKFDKCVYGYMAKHDPSWNKSYQLIYVRSGRNVKDVMYERADKACGANAFNKAGDAYVKEVNTSRQKSVQTYLDQVKARWAAQ
jgi:hypothetical protein